MASFPSGDDLGPLAVIEAQPKCTEIRPSIPIGFGGLLGLEAQSTLSSVLGEVEHPEVCEAIKKVERACKQANVKLGYFGVNTKMVLPYIDKGFTLITVGMDSLLLLNSAQQLYGELN